MDTKICACPNCKETIRADAEQCRFCGVELDQEALRTSTAELQEFNKILDLADSFSTRR